MKGHRRVSLVRHMLDRRYFKNYKKFAKDYTHRFKHREEYFTFVRAFFKETSKHITESTGGVYLKGFGYFCVLMLPEKLFLENKYKQDSNFNLHTDNYSYRLFFYPEQKVNTMMPMFAMERTFINKIKEDLTSNLRGGRRYKNFIYTVQSFWRRWKPLSLNDLENLKEANLDEYSSTYRGDKE